MRQLPEITQPMRLSAAYAAIASEDERYRIIRLANGRHAQVNIMSMQRDADKVVQVLDWFIDHDELFEALLENTPNDEPVNITPLLLNCFSSIS